MRRALAWGGRLAPCGMYYVVRISSSKRNVDGPPLNILTKADDLIPAIHLDEASHTLCRSATSHSKCISPSIPHRKSKSKPLSFWKHVRQNHSLINLTFLFLSSKDSSYLSSFPFRPLRQSSHLPSYTQLWFNCCPPFPITFQFPACSRSLTNNHVLASYTQHGLTRLRTDGKHWRLTLNSTDMSPSPSGLMSMAIQVSWSMKNTKKDVGSSKILEAHLLFLVVSKDNVSWNKDQKWKEICIWKSRREYNYYPDRNVVLISVTGKIQSLSEDVIMTFAWKKLANVWWRSAKTNKIKQDMRWRRGQDDTKTHFTRHLGNRKKSGNAGSGLFILLQKTSVTVNTLNNATCQPIFLIWTRKENAKTKGEE